MDKTILGNKLFILRNKHHLSEDGVAKQIGVSQQQYSKYEKGVDKISISRLEKLAKLFNVTIDELSSNNELTIVFEQISDSKYIGQNTIHENNNEDTVELIKMQRAEILRMNNDNASLRKVILVLNKEIALLKKK